ncbi:MAG: hypothetical protein A2173_01095 [Planctomycetes bacterium RBG_13_44_8b]|nr:MAG: hypothetical protein A2173_01095 [Planctomycetes bacterium RBG_13_44_8b]
MGSHRTQKGDRFFINVRLPTEWPPLPNNIGKTRRIKAIDRQIRHFRIEDEIIRKQSNSKRKIIILQKMRFVEEDRIEFRFGYYMLGIKPRARGKWVWGQFCLLIPKYDLIALMREAQRRKWFKILADADG